MIAGVCGGFQMLGKSIEDPLGVESDQRSAKGLGLLDVSTRFHHAKARQRVTGVVLDCDRPLVGYEIHMGETERGGAVVPWCKLSREADGSIVWDGAVDGSGRVFGTYVHGLFDSLPFTVALVNHLRSHRGLRPVDDREWESHRALLARRYAALADFLRAHVDLAPVGAAIGCADLRGGA
jgi:adenosylcobyric acid synthase